MKGTGMENEVTNLIDIWERTVGDTPPAAQFEIWRALHSVEVMKKGIISTARKNLSMNGKMSPEYRIRFASAVMNTKSGQEATRTQHTVANMVGVKSEDRGINECR
jgi:hypothetical protein